MEREQYRNMTEVELMSKIMRCDTDKADALLKYYNNDLLVFVDHLSYPNIQGVTSRMTSSLLAAIELCTRIESEKGQRQLVDRVIRDSKAILLYSTTKCQHSTTKNCGHYICQRTAR